SNCNPNYVIMLGSTFGSAIYFVDGTSLAWWSWLNRNNAPLTPPQSTLLHMVVLNALTGQATGKHDWSAPSDAVRYEMVQDGNFLTCIGNKIRLLSPDFQLLREVDLGPPYTCAPWAYSVGSGISPSRRSILFSSVLAQEHSSEILDTRALKVISTANEGKFVTITSISDHWLAGLCGNPRETCVRSMDGLWRAFSFKGPENQLPTGVRGSAYFVSDDTVLICRPYEMTVANADGSMLFRMNLTTGKSCENNPPAVSSQAARFALMENRELRTNEFLDVGAFWTDDRILVYDNSERRVIFALKVKGVSPWPSSTKHTNKFALSPDGNRLAVVSDGILKIYKLPDH